MHHKKRSGKRRKCIYGIWTQADTPIEKARLVSSRLSTMTRCRDRTVRLQPAGPAGAAEVCGLLIVDADPQ